MRVSSFLERFKGSFQPQRGVFVRTLWTVRVSGFRVLGFMVLEFRA